MVTTSTLVNELRAFIQKSEMFSTIVWVERDKLGTVHIKFKRELYSSWDSPERRFEDGLEKLARLNGYNTRVIDNKTWACVEG